ncbi:MAG TPA: hypothetical protein VG408_10935 [Actinomycetota bacterium]|nr:hypothetical protein [Actinomycetota bacterium]
MPIRFVTIAAILLLIGGGVALAIAVTGEPPVPASVTDRDDDRKSDLERDLDAVLNNDDEDAAAEQVDDDEDPGDTKGSGDRKSDGSGGTEGSGESGDG